MEYCLLHHLLNRVSHQRVSNRNQRNLHCGFNIESSHLFNSMNCLQIGLPSVKKYNAMAKAFDPIKAAGQKGDSSKAKDAYEKVNNLLTCSMSIVFVLCYAAHPIFMFMINLKAKAAVEAYLEAVELPAISDAVYD